jgi:secondary thiamine-phosphate synthase enzyme
MSQSFRTLRFATSSPVELVDLTDRIREEVRASRIRAGTVTIVSRHTTGGIAVNERDAALQQDMADLLKKLFPLGAGYAHDRAPVDGRTNAHAHLAGLFLRASETLPVRDGALDLGAWQAVFFVECDGGRAREVALVVQGDE